MRKKGLEKEMDKYYPLIPFDEIDDEARILAVRWMECDDKNWIEHRHKLASDFMNYAIRIYEKEKLFTRQQVIELLRKQRELCVDGYKRFFVLQQMGARVEDDILNAPEPSLNN